MPEPLQVVISSIEKEPFAKFSRLHEIEFAKIVRKGPFTKYTSCENLYVYGNHGFILIVYS